MTRAAKPLLKRFAGAQNLDETGGGTKIEPDCPVVTRTIFLDVGADGHTPLVTMRTNTNHFGGPITGRAAVTVKDIERRVGNLFGAWTTALLDGRPDGRGPLADRVRLAGAQDKMDDVWLELARAGHTLYTSLFSGNDPNMVAIRDRLEYLLRKRSQVILVSSAVTFVPWQMLYLPRPPREIGLPLDLDGFWGLKHLIEYSEADSWWRAPIKVDGSANVGAFVDTRLDNLEVERPGMPKVISPVLRSINLDPRSMVEVGSERPHLQDCLMKRPFPHHVIYFCCHGGEQNFALADGHVIEMDALDNWFDRLGRLDSTPMVFANTCRGGQISPEFYGSIARTFMKHGANCVLGPTIEVPPAFARSYAIRFLSRFLERHVTAGQIVQELALHYAQKHRNPLGLTYCLYRGVDSHLCEEKHGEYAAH